MTTNRGRASHNMATSALILAIISLATSCCIYLSLVCGALAIILAHLSSPDEMTSHPFASIAKTLGTIGIIATVGITAAAFAVAIHEYGSFEALLEQYDDIYNSLTTGNGVISDTTVQSLLSI